MEGGRETTEIALGSRAMSARLGQPCTPKGARGEIVCENERVGHERYHQSVECIHHSFSPLHPVTREVITSPKQTLLEEKRRNVMDKGLERVREHVKARGSDSFAID